MIVEIEKSGINATLCKNRIIVCKIRNSRLKAKQTAILEMLFTQYDNEIQYIKNGPLGDVQGLISFLCPNEKFESFTKRLYGTGYCEKFYILNFDDISDESNINLNSINPQIWKGRKFSVNPLYSQDSKIYEEQSPHNREFRIIGNDGEIKSIHGYRGDGTEYGRRSLPVEDARCMVNLSMHFQNTKMIDPFAGGGGILYAFRYIVSEGEMTSADNDPVLKPGLEFYGSRHYTIDSAEASFPQNCFDSIITETPFSINALPDITAALTRLCGSLTDNGAAVIMCGPDQYTEISQTLEKIPLYRIFDQKIDRKGTNIIISVWNKSREFMLEMERHISVLRKIF